MSSQFYFNSGEVASSVSDLANVLKNISDETFSYHCNKEKNDFYNWIMDGLENPDLAKKIKKIKSRKGLINRLKGL